MEHKLRQEIDKIIDRTEKRIEAGRKILSDVKKQLKNLRGKLKQYEKLKEQTISQLTANISDGDL